MIFVIDIGNTNIVLGCMEAQQALFVERMGTDTDKTALEYVIGFRAAFEVNNINPKDIEGAIISSVVPQLTNTIKDAIMKFAGIKAMVVGPGIKTGLNILIDNPKTVGADLVVDAVATLAEYGAPAIVIDMGTATTIVALDKSGNYLGGAIVPGINASLDSLVGKTAKLPRVSLESAGRAIGRTTEESMISGAVYGGAAIIDGMIDRFIKELGYSAKIIATGGMAQTIIPLCEHSIILDDLLLLKGLATIYAKNSEKKQ